jgi:SsrA-binding protein
LLGRLATFVKRKKPGAEKNPPSSPRSVENRRARHDYEFLETHEAGIALAGSEVKSVWLGRVNLTDSYCRVENGELWLKSLDIEPYKHASAFQLDRRRDRKLLMKRKEIDTLDRKVSEKGLALIPVRVYFKNGRVKVQIALAKGKREYDKRKQIEEKERRREMDRVQRRR